MPQVECLLVLYFGYIAGLFHAMGPIQSWKSPNFLSKWMEAVFVSVGCAASTTFKSLPSIVLPPFWWDYKMLWVVIYFGEDVPVYSLG